MMYFDMLICLRFLYPDPEKIKKISLQNKEFSSVKEFVDHFHFRNLFQIQAKYDFFIDIINIT